MQRTLSVDYRKESKSLQYDARSLADQGRRDPAREKYFLALQYLFNIEVKNAGDNRTLSNIYHNIANSYFSDKEFNEAVTYYNEGISSLVNIEKFNTALTDKDYRNLIELFIDLSDAYLHLFNREAADNAFSNAIKAFHLIDVKSLSEKKLENANDDYASFRIHYEQKTSSKAYLRSRIFNNNQKLLFDKRDENTLLGGLDNLTVSEIPMQNVHSLESQVNQMTMVPHLTFLQNPIQKDISDEEYRCVANEYIYLSNGDIAQQKTSDKISTIKQALSAYNKIQKKIASDHAIIKDLEHQLDHLYQIDSRKPVQIKFTEKPLQTTTSVIGMFGSYSPSQIPYPWEQDPQNDTQENDRFESGMDLC